MQSVNYGKTKVLDTATKLELDPAKTASKKVLHKPAKETRKLIAYKITDKTMKRKPIPDQNSKNVK